MGYEDRDYFQSKPKFEFSSGLHAGTKGLMIALIVCYIGGLIAADNTEFTDQRFWDAVKFPVEQQLWAYRVFVLIPQNVVPSGGFDPGYWKLLTHWLVAPGLISAIIEVIFVYFVGKMLEQLFGTRRFLTLFIGGCVVSGLLAALIDPLLVGSRFSVIMGATGGLVACYVTVLWIAPNQKSFFGWKTKHVVIGIVAAISLVSLLMGVFGGNESATLTPTQPVWGAAFGALYMVIAKKRGRVPSITGGFQQQDEHLEEWQKPGYMHDYKDKDFDEKKFKAVADKQRDDEDKAVVQRRAAKEKLDAILEKISEEGMTSLSRKEKKFLDEQSKKGKG